MANGEAVTEITYGYEFGVEVNGKGFCNYIYDYEEFYIIYLQYYWNKKDLLIQGWRYMEAGFEYSLETNI